MSVPQPAYIARQKVCEALRSGEWTQRHDGNMGTMANKIGCAMVVAHATLGCEWDSFSGINYRKIQDELRLSVASVKEVTSANDKDLLSFPKIAELIEKLPYATDDELKAPAAHLAPVGYLALKQAQQEVQKMEYLLATFKYSQAWHPPQLVKITEYA